MATGPHSASPQDVPPSALGTALTVLAAVVAIVALAGSLYLSLGMHLKACPLCFYQRTFVMGVVSVLCLGLLLGVRRSAVNALALPLAVGGLSVAVFHCYLEGTRVLECPAGVFGLGSAPQQSLAVHALLVLLIGAAVLADAARARFDAVVGVGAVVLGLLFAFAGVKSTPPPPPAPKTPYPLAVDEDGCRPPFHPASEIKGINGVEKVAP